MSEWTYEVNVNNDIWRGDLVNSREEAIEKGMREAKEEGFKNFKIGTAVKPLELDLDVEFLLERIAESYADEYGEIAEDYLSDVSREDQIELEQKLNKVFYEWIKEKGYTPSFYGIENEEIIKVKQEEYGQLQALLEEMDRNK